MIGRYQVYYSEIDFNARQNPTILNLCDDCSNRMDYTVFEVVVECNCDVCGRRGDDDDKAIIL